MNTKKRNGWEDMKKCGSRPGKGHAPKNQASLETNNIDIAACTHPGLIQKTNEDRYLVRTMTDNAVLLAVADGLGGDVSSDVAAEIAKNRLASLSHLPAGRETEFLDIFAKKLDLLIHQKASDHPSLAYMATTLVCTVLKNNMIHWVNIGDSRFYLLRNGVIHQITKDQTLAKALVEEGVLKPEDVAVHYSRKILDQCLGYGTSEPETGTLEIKQNDTIILATDGLYKMMEHRLMQRILMSDKRLGQKTAVLPEAALSSGGKDNITIVLAHVKQAV